MENKMSDENSVFLCNACHEKLKGRRVAYRHIKEGYGIVIEDENPKLEQFLENKFLKEIQIW